ncbi:hypothetical protein ACFLJY_004382 [Vibrio alginolyticus]
MTQNIEQRTLAATNTIETAAKSVDEIANQDKLVATPVGQRKSFPQLSREWESESSRLKKEWGDESQRLRSEWNNDSAVLREDWKQERDAMSIKALGIKPWENGVTETELNQQRRWTDNHTYLPKTVPALMAVDGPDDNWVPYTADKADMLNDVFGRKPIDLVAGITLTPDVNSNYPKLNAFGKVWELSDDNSPLVVTSYAEAQNNFLVLTLDTGDTRVATHNQGASRYWVKEKLGEASKTYTQALIDQVDKDWFIGDSFLVMENGASYKIVTGIGYVSGHRVTLDNEFYIDTLNVNEHVYVDAWFELDVNGRQQLKYEIKVSSLELVDYVDMSKLPNVEHFVCKIASKDDLGNLIDRRLKLNKERVWRQGDIVTSSNQAVLFLGDENSPAYNHKYIAVTASQENPITMGASPLDSDDWLEINTGGVISVERFGSIAYDATQATRLALEYSAAYGVRVVCDRPLPVKNLVIPNYALFSLTFTNVDNTSTMVYLNGRDVDMGKTTFKPRSGFTGLCFSIDDTSEYVTVNSFHRLVAERILFDCLSAQECRSFDLLLKKNSCSFWDIGSIVIWAAKTGFHGLVGSDKAGLLPYFTSNTIWNYEVWAFETDPFTLSTISGMEDGEISDNFIIMKGQPNDRTISGVYIGGRKCMRNRFAGIIWDWMDVYNKNGNPSITDRGLNNKFEGFKDQYTSLNLTTIVESAGPTINQPNSVVVASGMLDKSVSGTQDNLLHFADKKPHAFLITLSHPFDYSNEDRLFSLNTFDDVRWNVATPDEERVLTIEFLDGPQRIQYASVTSNANGLAKYCKVEYKDSNGNWVLRSEDKNSINGVKGYNGGSVSGNGVEAYGLRFTLKNPVSYNYTTGEESPGTYISLANVFAKSTTNTKHHPFLSAYNPEVNGSLHFSEHSIVSIEGKQQQKAIRVYDESGAALGYIPIYD